MCWPGVSCLYNIFSNNLPSFVQMQSSGKLLPLLCLSSAPAQSLSLSLLWFCSGSTQFWFCSALFWLFNRSISVQVVGILFQPYKVHIFMRLPKVLPPATCNLQGSGGGELIYSLQIKSGVENQLVCALFCFYLYRVNILCLSYADPLAS